MNRFEMRSVAGATQKEAGNICCFFFNTETQALENTTRRHHRRDGESTDGVMLHVAQKYAPQQKDGFIERGERPPLVSLHRDGGERDGCAESEEKRGDVETGTRHTHTNTHSRILK